MRELKAPRITPAGTARYVAEQFFNDDGHEVERADATRWVRAYFRADWEWLADEVGTIGEWADADAPALEHWTGVLAVEERPTGDSRLMQAGALRWDTPLPLRWAAEDNGAHDGAQVVGTITGIDRTDDGQIVARGTFDLGSDVGREAARHITEGLTTGVSVDLDDTTVSVRVAADVLADGPFLDLDDAPAPDGDGMVEVLRFSPDDEVMVVEDARIRAATIVATPAFVEARLEPVDGFTLETLVAAAADSVQVGDVVSWTTDDGEGLAGTVTAVNGEGDEQTVTVDTDEDTFEVPVADVTVEIADDDNDDATVIAAAAPVAPPAEWFTDPELSGPTPLTITDDGRVFGHAALWNGCHTAFDRCVSPPRTAAGYAYFHTGALETAEGTTVGVGRLTMGTGHASMKAGARPAAEHYDNSGTAWADVRAGEDQHGLWIAGALRPGLTDEQVRVARSSPLSGDWRAIGGNLELVACLSVNSPGFPVPRARVASSAADQPLALVAAGVLDAAPTFDLEHPSLLSPGDVAALKRLANRERSTRRAELRRKVHGSDARYVEALASRVHTP